MTTELDNLDHVAAQADAGTATVDMTPEQQAQAQGPDYNTEARVAVDMFAAMVVGYAPKAEPIWNEGAKNRVSEALTPVMKKYKLSMGELPCELVLIIVAGPMLWQSSKIVAAQIDADKAQESAPARIDKPAQAQTIEPKPEPARASDYEDAPNPATSPQVALYA